MVLWLPRSFPVNNTIYILFLCVTYSCAVDVKSFALCLLMLTVIMLHVILSHWHMYCVLWLAMCGGCVVSCPHQRTSRIILEFPPSRSKITRKLCKGMNLHFLSGIFYKICLLHTQFDKAKFVVKHSLLTWASTNIVLNCLF